MCGNWQCACKDAVSIKAHAHKVIKKIYNAFPGFCLDCVQCVEEGKSGLRDQCRLPLDSFKLVSVRHVTFMLLQADTDLEPTQKVAKREFQQ